MENAKNNLHLVEADSDVINEDGEDTVTPAFAGHKAAVRKRSDRPPAARRRY